MTIIILSTSLIFKCNVLHTYMYSMYNCTSYTRASMYLIPYKNNLFPAVLMLETHAVRFNISKSLVEFSSATKICSQDFGAVARLAPVTALQVASTLTYDYIWAPMKKNGVFVTTPCQQFPDDEEMYLAMKYANNSYLKKPISFFSDMKIDNCIEECFVLEKKGSDFILADKKCSTKHKVLCSESQGKFY